MNFCFEQKALGKLCQWKAAGVKIVKAWFPYRCICRICRVCRTKKIHRTGRIHSISYNRLYLSFLLYWAFVRGVSIKLYLSYEFFSHDWHDRYDRYNEMETRLQYKRNDRYNLLYEIEWILSFLWIFFVRQTRQIRQIQPYGNQA